MSIRPWLIPAVAALAAVAFLVAGVVAWRMTWPPAHVGDLPRLYVPAPRPHRLHPLRAELLWAASALFALVAIGTWLRWRESDTEPTVTA